MSISVPVSSAEAAPRAAPAALQVEAVAQLRNNAPAREGQQRTESPFQPNATNVDARLIEGQQVAVDLRAEAAKNQDPTAVMERARHAVTPSLSSVEQQSLARVNTTLAQEAAQFDTYSSIVSEAARNGQTVEHVVAARNIPQADFDHMRGEVLQRIGNLGYLRQVIPGLDNLDPATRDAFVENYFAANPLVRETYLAEMRGVAARAAGIPESGPGNASKQTELTADRAAAGNRLRGRLGEAGNGLTDTDIADMFKGGKTVEEVRAQIFDRTLQARGVNAADVRARDGFQAQITTIENQIQVLDRQLSGNPANRDALAVQRVGLEQQLNGARTAVSKITIPAEHEPIIQAVDTDVYGTVDVRAGGVKTGGIEGELRSISQSLSAEQKLGAATLSPEQQAVETQRQLQMEQLRNDMTAAMERAVDQTLSQQYQDAQDLQNRKVEAEAQRLEKQGETRLADAERRMVKKEDEDWVGKDKAKRKRTVHRDRIGADIKRVAEEGADGVRRIMLRQMSTGEGPVIQLNGPDGKPLQGYGPDNKPLVDAQGKPVPATWETVRMSDLGESDQKLLNELYDHQHVQLEDRLLRDFDFAKHPRGIRDSFDLLGSVGDLNLSKDEYGYLREQFGARMEKAADASEAMRNITAELKAKGIEPGGFMGFLMTLATLAAGIPRKKEA